jgi:hypothetical protein
VDLLFGCGGLYLVAFALLWWLGPRMAETIHLGVLPLAVLALSLPHYGATLLRVYERREDRRHYAFFAFGATALVWGWFAVGVHAVAIGSALVTLYLTWSPWHYSGQNYGVGMLLLRRAGVAVSPFARRMWWLSFVLSFALVALSIHASVPGAAYTPTVTSPLADGAFSFRPIGLPLAWLGPLLLVLGAAYAVTTAAGCVALLRAAPAAALVPMGAIVVLQALWFSLPVLASVTTLGADVLPLGAAHRGYVLLWVALGHSLQYVWITTWFAVPNAGARERAGYWLRSFLAGAAAFGLPSFLFAPELFGRHAFETGLGLLVTAAVNVHHFVLDGAIWKLRDGRIALILLGPRAATATPAPAIARRWAKPLVWGGVGAIGFAYAAFSAVGTVELEYGFRRALDPPDAERLQVAARRLERVGHSHPALHLNLGILAERAGDLATAQREAERSLALAPSPEGWLLLGNVHGRASRPDAAARAYEAVLALAPDHLVALSELAAVSVARGDLARAESALRRAVEVAPERPQLRERLAAVQRLRARAAGAPPS